MTRPKLHFPKKWFVLSKKYKRRKSFLIKFVIRLTHQNRNYTFARRIRSILNKISNLIFTPCIKTVQKMPNDCSRYFSAIFESTQVPTYYLSYIRVGKGRIGNWPEGPSSWKRKSFSFNKNA